MALKDLQEEVDRYLFDDSHALTESACTSLQEDLQNVAISTIVALVWNETVEECIYKLVKNVAAFDVKEKFLNFLDHLCWFSGPCILNWT